jgi:hypothetical protein
MAEYYKSVLEWWDIHRSDTVQTSDGDEDNLFDEPPFFVYEAMKMKDKETEIRTLAKKYHDDRMDYESKKSASLDSDSFADFKVSEYRMNLSKIALEKATEI